MKIPTLRPGSNTFMVFSMLLLGVFSAVLVVVLDATELAPNRLTTTVLAKINANGPNSIPLPWAISVGGLALMAAGFFFYLCSFLLLAGPSFYVRQLAIRGRRAEDDLFLFVSTQALERFLPPSHARAQTRRFRDGFMYLLLTSSDSHIAAAARFSFTQLMFARSLGAVFCFYSLYVSWALALPLDWTCAIFLICWVAVCCLYGMGLSFYEVVMTSGVMIERLHEAAPAAPSLQPKVKALRAPRQRRRSAEPAPEPP